MRNWEVNANADTSKTISVPNQKMNAITIQKCCVNTSNESLFEQASETHKISMIGIMKLTSYFGYQYPRNCYTKNRYRVTEITNDESQPNNRNTEKSDAYKSYLLLEKSKTAFC